MAFPSTFHKNVAAETTTEGRRKPYQIRAPRPRSWAGEAHHRSGDPEVQRAQRAPETIREPASAGRRPSAQMALLRGSVTVTQRRQTVGGVRPRAQPTRLENELNSGGAVPLPSRRLRKQDSDLGTADQEAGT